MLVNIIQLPFSVNILQLPRFPSFLSFVKVMKCMEYSKICLNLIFAALNLTFMGG